MNITRRKFFGALGLGLGIVIINPIKLLPSKKIIPSQFGRYESFRFINTPLKSKTYKWRKYESLPTGRRLSYTEYRIPRSFYI